MNKRLIIRIKEYNSKQKDYNSVFNLDNSKRIIIKTLKPNCDKSLKQLYSNKLMSQIKPYGQKI